MPEELRREQLLVETGAERIPNSEVFFGEYGGCCQFLADQYVKPKNKAAVRNVIDEVVAEAEDKRPNVMVSDFLRPQNAPYVDPDKLVSKGYQLELSRLIKERMKEGEPFLHAVISAKLENKSGDAGQIIVSGGLRNQTMAVDPVIADWLKEKLDNKLKKEGVGLYDVEESKMPLVGVAKEGERFCGAIVHAERRKKELGKLYQFMQLKVPIKLIQQYGNILNQVLADIFSDFQQEFPDKQALEEYLDENTTEEDKVRLEGKIYKEVLLVSDDDKIISESDTTTLENNHIALTKNLASALGVLEGDQVRVVADDDPKEKQFIVTIVKKINKKIPRQPVFSDRSEIKNGQKVIISK